MKYGLRTYKARSETVATLKSFKPAWSKAQRCIIPAEAIYEPRYFGTVEKPGKSVRYRISQPGAVPLGVAGSYQRWKEPRGDKSCAAGARREDCAAATAATGVVLAAGTSLV